MAQQRIADQIAAMTSEPRHRLFTEFPRQVGNTDGVPWDLRVAANLVNIAQAIVDERGGDPDSARRVAVCRSLLSAVDDPTLRGRRVDRQILAFDPGRARRGRAHRGSVVGDQRGGARSGTDRHDRGVGLEQRDRPGIRLRDPWRRGGDHLSGRALPAGTKMC